MTGPVIPTNRGYAASGWRLAVGDGNELPPDTRCRHLPPENLQRQLGQHAVLPLPRYSGCDVIASLPESAEDEGEESEGQDDDDYEAAAVWAAAVDAALPLVPEFPFGAHFVRS
jgi:hypothetical protein